MKKYDLDSAKKWIPVSYFARPKTTSTIIRCPFCQVEIEVRVWSLNGSGKLCPGCGAIHTGPGKTYPLKQQRF